MAQIVLNDITKRFGKVVAVNGLSLEIEEGEFVTLLGPSGCGKTSTLRAISGLEEPDEGEIYIKNRCAFSSQEEIFIPPGKRGLGMVFQSYALWPHMTVQNNVGFGLEELHYKREDIKRKVKEVLARLEIDSLAERYPSELSGGQQQRVSIARMIAPEPGIFLMDEPLSNLDAKLRMSLRSELKRLNKDIGATTVYVTHDQIEAMSLSDRILVLNNGSLQQADSPENLYRYPANLFTAEFMGNPTNLVAGQVISKNSLFYFQSKNGDLNISLDRKMITGLKPNNNLVIAVRPECLELKEKKESDSIEMTVYSVLPAGSETIVYARTGKATEIVIKKPREEIHGLSMDQRIYVRFKAVNFYDAKTESLIASMG